MFCSVMSAEILRICKTTTKFQDFRKSSVVLIGRIIKQGGLIKRIKKALLKLLNSHDKCFIKFGQTNGYI